MYHTLILVGNVGKDAEMRYTPQGSPVTSFSVASNRQYNHDGETKKETIWFRVTVWGKQAETCNEFVRKGMKVLVEGRLTPDASNGSPRQWKDKDGEIHSDYEVTAGTVRFLSSVTKPAESQGGEQQDLGEKLDFGEFAKETEEKVTSAADSLTARIREQAEAAADLGAEAESTKVKKPAAKKAAKKS